MNNEILDILKQNKSEIFSRYPLQSMAVFGSCSRGDNNDNSDVDILVELNGTMGFRFLHLNYEIESLLKRKVDLISKRALKQEFLKEIETELIYVWNIVNYQTIILFKLIRIYNFLPPTHLLLKFFPYICALSQTAQQVLVCSRRQQGVILIRLFICQRLKQTQVLRKGSK